MGKDFEPGWLTDFSEDPNNPAEPQEIPEFCYSGHPSVGAVRGLVTQMNELRMDRLACGEWQDLENGVTCTGV